MQSKKRQIQTLDPINTPLHLQPNTSVLFIGENIAMAESFAYFLTNYTSFFFHNALQSLLTLPTKLIYLDTKKQDLKKIDNQKPCIFFAPTLSLQMQQNLQTHMNNKLQIIFTNKLNSAECISFCQQWIKTYEMALSSNTFKSTISALSKKIYEHIDNLFLLEHIIDLTEYCTEEEILIFIHGQKSKKTTTKTSLRRIYLLKTEKIH